MNQTNELSQNDIEQQIKALKDKLPKKVRKPKKLPVAISEEEFTLLLKNTNMEKHKVAFLLGFGSGLRVSEIINLKPEQIDLKERKIFISQAKGSKDRIVPLAKGFQDRHLKLFPIKFKNIKSGSRSLEIAFKEAAKRAGLLDKKQELHFHSLRHGFASQAVANGIPIHHIRTLMGHSNISTTNVYLEANPKDALKSYEELF